MAIEKDSKTSYTPSADAKSVSDSASKATKNAPADGAGAQKSLGTGAIVGIVAASVALLAGAFGSGYAVASATHPGGRPGDFAANGQLPGQMPGQMRDRMQDQMQGQMPGGPRGIDPDGDNWTGQNRMQGGQQNMQQNQLPAPAPSASTQVQTN